LRLSKRAFDIAVAGVLLVLLAPLGIVIVLAMWVSMLCCRRDRGGLLYGEPRISRGAPFRLLKFRTLRRDALARMEGERHARLLENERENLTWAGRRILKPWYLDELPQLFNVLRGDMSLVGPRPWPRSLVDRQVADGHDYRLHVTPGWTGPAQVSKGRGDASFTAADLGYLEKLETLPPGALVRYDLGILWATVRTMLRGEGLRF
jgi:lipopolysaccharide/colanic/teichoic acid biosynthesis glycosyltransferase